MVSEKECAQNKEEMFLKEEGQEEEQSYLHKTMKAKIKLKEFSEIYSKGKRGSSKHFVVFF
jgi:hypothetical protein